jgi:hypothetical protein
MWRDGDPSDFKNSGINSEFFADSTGPGVDLRSNASGLRANAMLNRNNGITMEFIRRNNGISSAGTADLFDGMRRCPGLAFHGRRAARRFQNE